MGNYSAIALTDNRPVKLLLTILAALSIVSGAMGGSANAEEASADAPIKVTFLGTGTPVPNPRQFGPSILVEAGGQRLLFDCGRGCASRLWIIDHDHLRKTQHLFLTHMHSDHTVGVPDLYMNGWNLGRQGDLVVYGPAAADDYMRHLRLAFEEDVVFRAEKQNHSVTREGLSHSVVEVADGQVIEFGDEVTVTTIAVDHHVIEPAFGFRIDAGGHSVVISGDTAYSKNLVHYSTDADLLIHEVMSPALEEFVRTTFPVDVADDIVALHTLAPDVGRVFTESGVRFGVLTHLDNDPKLIPELAEQIKSTWEGDFVVAEDLMVIEVGEEIRITKPPAE